MGGGLADQRRGPKSTLLDWDPTVRSEPQNCAPPPTHTQTNNLNQPKWVTQDIKSWAHMSQAAVMEPPVPGTLLHNPHQWWTAPSEPHSLVLGLPSPSGLQGIQLLHELWYCCSTRPLKPPAFTRHYETPGMHLATYAAQSIVRQRDSSMKKHY